MQRKLVQGPAPPFFTTPQISTTVAANSQHSQEIPTPLLEGPCPACSYHDQACFAPFYHREIQILLVLQVYSLKYCSFPPCWSLPLAEGSSCCARLAGHLWTLILAPQKCGCQGISSDPVPSSFLWLFVACHAFAQGTVP